MNHKFITDNGGPHLMHDEQGKEAGFLPRYGVWALGSRGKNEVIEVGDDLAQLQAKYAIPDERVLPLPPPANAVN